jgi:amino acid transporter
MTEEKELKRGLNLPMAIFIIIGMVIGASIWVSPAEILSSTGPAIFIAYILAAIPAIFVAYLSAYLGSAFPISGGTYVISSRLTGPFGGFMTVWLIILAVGATLAFLATTFGVFLGKAFGVPAEAELAFSIIVGLIVLVVFYFLNWIRIELSGLIELIITIVGDILVMVIFIIAAIPSFNPSNFEPLFPLGFGPVLFAALTFFFSYTGFTLILDIAGEVKNPKKNIPRAVLISIIVLTVLYTLQALMIAGVQNWSSPVGNVIELISSGGLLPQGVVVFMAILIAVAIASTLHPSYMAFSRDIMMIGKEHLFPKRLGKVSEKHKTPIQALTLLFIVGVVFLLVFIPLLEPTYGVNGAAVLLSAVVAVVVLILQIPVSLAAIILPKKFPDWHEKAGFKPSLRSLKVMGILGAVFSLIFVLLIFTETVAAIIISFTVFPFAVIGVIAYLIRNAMLKKAGIDVKEILKTLPKSASIED